VVMVRKVREIRKMGGVIPASQGSVCEFDSAEKLVNMICHRRKQTLRIAK